MGRLKSFTQNSLQEVRCVNEMERSGINVDDLFETGISESEPSSEKEIHRILSFIVA
jgi:hypothetical protein